MQVTDMHGAFNMILKADKISTTQESPHVKTTQENSAHHFLQYQFIPQGQSTRPNVEIFQSLHEAACRKSPELWPSDGFSTMTML
jgi:hypothetical protein